MPEKKLLDIQALQAVKDYVDQQDALKLDKVTTGGALRAYVVLANNNQSMMAISTSATGNALARYQSTGALTVGTPSANTDAATKKYVDDLVGGKYGTEIAASATDPTKLVDSSTGKFALSLIPDIILGQLVYGGTVNAKTGVATLTDNAKTKLGTTSNTVTLVNQAADGSNTYGWVHNQGLFYVVDTSSASGQDFAGLGLIVGDWLISTGSAWKKIDNTDSVTGVKGQAESTYRIGNVNITRANIGISHVTTSGSESITLGSDTFNIVTRNTAQVISGKKTFGSATGDRVEIDSNGILYHSTGGSSTRKGLTIQGYGAYLRIGDGNTSPTQFLEIAPIEDSVFWVISHPVWNETTQTYDSIGNYLPDKNGTLAVLDDIPTKDSDLTNDRYVRFDVNTQGLTATQKTNARTNIGAGTVTSVRVQAGTGLSSSQSAAQTGTLDTTISIASGYKLPTSTEWGKVVLTEGNQVIAGTKTFGTQNGDRVEINSNGILYHSTGGSSTRKGLTIEGYGAYLRIGDGNTTSTQFIEIGAIEDAAYWYISHPVWNETASRYDTVSNTLPDKNGTLAVLEDIPDVSLYLPLAGGTMSGDIDMDGNTIQNLVALSVGYQATGFTFYEVSSGNYISSARGLTINAAYDINLNTGNNSKAYYNGYEIISGSIATPAECYAVFGMTPPNA